MANLERHIVQLQEIRNRIIARIDAKLLAGATVEPRVEQPREVANDL